MLHLQYTLLLLILKPITVPIGANTFTIHFATINTGKRPYECEELQLNLQYTLLLLIHDFLY